MRVFNSKISEIFFVILILAGTLLISGQMSKADENKQYSINEIISAGESFFGSTSGSLAKTVERIFSSYGLPNGYVLGEEISGSWIIGVTYGDGTLYTKNLGDHKVFWQGPSFGVDFGGQGSQVMILAYNIANIDDVYQRFGGVSGAAYLIAGFGFNVLKRNDQLLVPIRTGVGARLGLNVGYLSLTKTATWNPF